MAILNQAFVDGVNAVARTVELHARQTVSSAISSATSATVTTPSPTDSTVPSPTNSPDPTTTSANNGGGGGGGTSSPLLFFVALGFGVVFTNLWIIVGVKYCFRYNARNRQMRGLDENGEPINLENMPARPHRRRREKKLMTMDEVNEKFPMMKYKTWVAGRAKEGLPTAGGVSAPASRANSVRSVEGVVPEVPSKEHESTDQTTMTAAGNHTRTESADAATTHENENDNTLTHTQTAGSIMTKDIDKAHASDDEEEDDDHINAAVPPELLGSSGDTCAICIDTLEDDDDVRGLTCGHAFHAVCLDPWLTNRRACCPLCKADYYTPKPRPPPTEGDPNQPTSPTTDPSRNNGRMNMPRQPQRSLGWGLRDARDILGRYGNTTQVDSHGRPRRSDRERERDRRRRHAEARSRNNTRAARTTTAPEPQQQQQQQEGQQQGWMTRIRGRLPMFRQNGEATPSTAANTAETTTPAQLEAGTRTTS